MTEPKHMSSAFCSYYFSGFSLVRGMSTCPRERKRVCNADGTCLVVGSLSMEPAQKRKAWAREMNVDVAGSKWK
jgi:hypothetical protein